MHIESEYIVFVSVVMKDVLVWEAYLELESWLKTNDIEEKAKRDVVGSDRYLDDRTVIVHLRVAHRKEWQPT